MFQTKPCCSVFKIEYRWEYKKTVHEVDNYTFPGMNGLWSSNSKSCFYCLRKGEKSYCLILIHSILDVQYPLLQSFLIMHGQPHTGRNPTTTPKMTTTKTPVPKYAFNAINHLSCLTLICNPAGKWPWYFSLFIAK